MFSYEVMSIILVGFGQSCLIVALHLSAGDYAKKYARNIQLPLD